MSQLIEPQHKEIRTLLRVIGPCILLVGLIFTIIGFASSLSSFGSFGPPRYFWCVFIGMPLIFIGSVICMYAFMGALSRYTANEMTPVGKDVVNYMAEGTKDAIRDVAAAVSEGLQAGASSREAPIICCPKCHADNEAPANYCKVCGASLTNLAVKRS